MSLAATATRLLTKFGDPVLIEFETGGDVDPATGVVTTPPTENELTGFGYPSRYRNMDVDGANVLASDIRFVTQQLSQRPQKGWDATVDGTKYRVMNVQPIRSQGEDIIYICQLRAQ